MTIEKTRRCFVWQNQIWQLDIYRCKIYLWCNFFCSNPLFTTLSGIHHSLIYFTSTPHPGLMLLETYTAVPPNQLVMPDFLTVKREVTGESRYTSNQHIKAVSHISHEYHPFLLSPSVSIDLFQPHNIFIFSSYSMFNLSKTTKITNGINGLEPDQDWKLCRLYEMLKTLIVKHNDLSNMETWRSVITT